MSRYLLAPEMAAVKPLLESRAARALSRLASVPGDPKEAHAFLQRRVRIYTGVGAILWAVVLVAYVASFEHEQTFAHIAAHAIATVFLTAAYLIARRKETSVRMLSLIEAAATLLQVFAFILMCKGYPALWRSNSTMLIGVGNVLSLRAAVIPGSPLRAFVIGVIAHVPILAATIDIHGQPGRSPDLPPFAMEVATTIVWSCVSLAISVVIVHVIYGLRQSVRAAMELGQYTLLRRIGEGAMGAVYFARHALLRRPTAVKMLKAEGEVGDQMLARFEREVQLTSEIAHPNVISVYDFGRSPDGVFYYAMEYLEGVDLQRIVQKFGPMPAARARYIIAQAADGLAEAHAFGLIHRDVKPANLILSPHLRRPDHVKVVDFGLVKELSKTTSNTLSGNNILTGTPLYMAPEAVTNPENVDERSDVYALGAVAYFLIAGRPPFIGKSILEVLAQHVHETPKRFAELGIKNVPAKLEALILRALSKDKNDRPKSAEVFLRELRACDDVGPWSVEDAAAWWEEHREDLSSPPQRTDDDPSHVSSEDELTLRIAPRSLRPKRASA